MKAIILLTVLVAIGLWNCPKHKPEAFFVKASEVGDSYCLYSSGEVTAHGKPVNVIPVEMHKTPAVKTMESIAEAYLSDRAKTPDEIQNEYAEKSAWYSGICNRVSTLSVPTADFSSPAVLPSDTIVSNYTPPAESDHLEPTE